MDTSSSEDKDTGVGKLIDLLSSSPPGKVRPPLPGEDKDSALEEGRKDTGVGKLIELLSSSPPGKVRPPPPGTPPSMPTNCSESTNAIFISIEMPNVKRDDVHVTFNQQTRELVISSRSDHEPMREGEVFCLHERKYGCMSRTYVLPDFITATGATVEFKEDSVLRISFPKKKKGATLPARGT